ncbi:leucine-rich repeat protein 1 [Eurytemora carolleeae]|uniref:leucine-rich repeat protein 1 n=1 Tax=Eurytemora carolleeae TaxID=1294199 RepID=UPI000C77D1B1|nr:leucine-rich repeat protein 1 [Eurytemora carolleeae]|eukprot:XP_023348251.1 leucine-rich repeat protein 1-like [Eurytemora affinis]
MKLYAEVEVVNRSLACHNMKGIGKKVRSHLAIGKKPLPDGKHELFIMITNAQNKQGTKYMIMNNIQTVFTKLINEGKTTIRLKEPDHDICIKGDVIEVKSFLSVLKKVLTGQDVEKLTLSSLQPLSSKQISGPKRRLHVTKRGDYPVKEGFPQTLTSVRINDIRLARIDSRLLKLVNLTELDMAGNEIELVPDNFDSLPSLTQLNLADNQISSLPRGFCTGLMAKSLKLLNLNGNKIKLLPNYFCQLRTLVTLSLNKNELTLLPPSLGKLRLLKHLSVCDNHLKILPGSFSSLRLDSLELSNNPMDEASTRVLSNKLEPVSSLLEISASTVVKLRINYDPEDLFPQLLAYLDSGMHCPCSKPVWNNVARALVKLSLSRVSSTFSCDGLNEVCMDASLCSSRCLNLFMNNPFAF